jgi:hypothetical protein
MAELTLVQAGYKRYLLAVRTLVLAVALGVSIIVSGCSGGDESADTTRIVRTGATAEVRDGKLTADPAPLTFAQIAEAGRTTPAGSVLSLYFWAQWGSIPNVVNMYDPRVRSAVGPMRIADAYVDQRVSLLGTLVVIRNVVSSPLGKLVTVDALTKNYPVVHDSFLLQRRRRSGRWYVVHDTLLERGLAVIVGAQASRGLTGQAAVRRAQRAGGVAARNFRSLAMRLAGLTGGSPRRP